VFFKGEENAVGHNNVTYSNFLLQIRTSQYFPFKSKCCFSLLNNALIESAHTQSHANTYIKKYIYTKKIFTAENDLAPCQQSILYSLI